jgi:hypothetical protein
MVRSIPLRRGPEALVDDADYAWLSRFRWSWNGHYAFRCRPKYDIGPSFIFMHRLIMGVDGVPIELSGEVDHRNKNKLDNRRSNLLLTDHAGNARNRAPRSASGFKGVRRALTRREGWVAYISTARSYKYLGTFPTIAEAVAARTAADQERGS